MAKPSNYEMTKITNRVIESEKLNIDDDAVPFVVKHAMGDVRRLINILQDIHIAFGDKDVSVEEVLKLFETFDKKDLDIQIYESTMAIFNKKLRIEELISYFEMGRLLLPIMLHENYPYIINNREIDLPESLHKMIDCIDALIENDIFQTNMFKTQSWPASEPSGALLCGKINHIVTNLKKSIITTDTIKYTSLSNKISLYHTNLKLINSLNSRLGINLTQDEIYFLSEIIVYHLYNKNGKKEEIVKILKRYNLSIDDIDVLIRINKFNN